MRIPTFFLGSILLAACSGDTDGNNVGDDDDTVVGDDDDTVVGDDDDTVVADPCEQPGNICTWLGFPGLAGLSGEGLPRASDGLRWSPTDETLLYLPVDVTFAPDGTAYYPDYNAHRIREIAPDGTVNTVSGTGQLGDGPNTDGSANNCWGGCDALLSAWNHPTDVAINPDAANEIYVAAWHNSRINVVDLDANTLSWVACSGGRQYGASDLDADGNFLDDCVADLPSGIAFGNDGWLYFSDQANHAIRRMNRATGAIELVAGEPRKAGMDGDGGPATLAHLHGHTDQRADPGSKIVIDGDVLYFVDSVNGVVRSIDLVSGIIDTVAGKFESIGTGVITDGATGTQYTADLGSVTGYSGDGGPALDAVMNTPRDLAIGIDGEIYIADTKNNCVRVVRNGTMERFAGQCGEPEVLVDAIVSEDAFGSLREDRDLRDAALGNGGPALDASFGPVYGVAVDAEGNVYIADTNNHVIRRVKR